jgi:hypothetical protein
VRVLAGVRALVGVLLLIATVAGANEGTGTQDFCARHGCTEWCGTVAPCPVVSCPTCPVCPTVTTDDGGTTIVNVERCPACPESPRYIRCRYKHDGTVQCPIKDHPHRVFVPESK